MSWVTGRLKREAGNIVLPQQELNCMGRLLHKHYVFPGGHLSYGFLCVVPYGQQAEAFFYLHVKNL
jgi:hypothetical protein